MIFAGRITKSRGNRGEVVINLLPGIEACVLKRGGEVRLISEKHSLDKKIENIRQIRKNTLLKLRGIDCIEDALRIVGYSVFLKSSRKDAKIRDDYTGFKVLDVKHEVQGEVTEVIRNELNPMIEIRDLKDRLILIPLAESIIKEINEKKHEIIIDPPEGLMDLNR